MALRTLQRLLEPNRVALVGASADAGSIAGTLTEQILTRFPGEIHLVNPNRSEIAGRPVHSSIGDLPEGIDLAIVTSPADTVEDVVRALAEKGAAGAVVIADLKRGRMPAAELRRRLRAIALESGLRVLGPNSLGIAAPGAGLFATMSHMRPGQGGVAFVGQSATAAGPIVDWAQTQGIGFSHLVSLGDMIDVDYADLLYFLAESPEAKVILLYAERFANPRRFLSAARYAGRVKPVLIVKSAYEGEVAPGPPETRDLIYEGAFRRSGLIRLRTLDDVFDALTALAVRTTGDVRPALGPRVAILCNGESIGALAMDALSSRGGTLATLGDETRERIEAALPPGRPRHNPVDILADADADRYRAAMDALMDDPGIDTIVAISGATGVALPTENARAVTDVVTARRKGSRRRRPWVLTSWPGGPEVETARAIFAEARIPTFETPTEAIAAHAYLREHRRSVERLQETPASAHASFNVNPEAARALLGGLAAGGSGSGRLGSVGAAEVFSTYGLPAPLAALPIAGRKLPPFRLAGFLDDEFGPLLFFGLGGGWGAKLDAGAIGLPPLTQTLALDLIRQSDAGRALFDTPEDGLNTDGPQDPALQALVLLVQVASQFMVDVPEAVSFEINPIYVDGDGARYAGAELEYSGSVPQSAVRGPAIRPYPKDLETTLTIRDRDYLLRPIRPEDEPEFRAFYDGLEPEHRRLRFFHPLKQVDHQLAARLTQIDYDRQMAFVLTEPGLPGAAPVLGVVRLVIDPGEEAGEYAISVSSALHGAGIGRLLMERIIDYARSLGLKDIYGLVLEDNEAMLGLAKKLGFGVHRSLDEPGVLKVLRPL